MTEQKHILVIPDAHSHPDYANDRFDVLGDYINRTRPDVVISIGDWADMASICEHSSKLSLEGARYKDDCASVIDSQARMFSHLTYEPELYMTLGNHDARIEKIAAQNPQLQGVISMDDLQYEAFGWDVRRFRTNLNLQGWNFQHYFPTGMSGRPISGLLAAKALVTKNHESCVQGHSHLMGYHNESTASGKRIHGVVVGCYSSAEQIEDWNQNTEYAWWRGVVHIHGAKDGDGGVQFVPAEQMEAEGVRTQPTRSYFGPALRQDVPDVTTASARGKLTDAQVRHIRTAPLTAKALGRQYDMNPSTISKIRKRKRYAHVS